jgi:uncharacterized protein YjiS (DUF1127 family)
MFGFLDNYRKIRARSRRRKAAARELSAFDDRQLKDIGISRGQIWAATGGFDPRNDPGAGLK